MHVHIGCLWGLGGYFINGKLTFYLFRLVLLTNYVEWLSPAGWFFGRNRYRLLKETEALKKWGPAIKFVIGLLTLAAKAAASTVSRFSRGSRG
jgi:hypothetical protein